MLEAFFDESGTHDGSEFMCISGYIFAKTPCESLVIKWQELLDDYDLPFFHMVECAPCKGVYAHLDMTQCDSAARRAYSLIREYMTIGFSVSLELRHENLIPKRNIYKSAYTFLCWQALQMIRKWANGQNYTGQIAYFFEDGHESKPEANQIMADLFRLPYLKQAYRRYSHTFADKRCVLPLQCADILAWHTYEQLNRGHAGKQIRKDANALWENSAHLFWHFDEKELNRFSISVIEADRIDKEIRAASGGELSLAPHDLEFWQRKQPQ